METLTNDLALTDLSSLCQNRLKQIYSRYLNEIPSLELKTSMEYAVLHDGKYIRPLLIYATGAIFSTPFEILDIPASSVELIHTYSLLHDDLPCMDNADMRRGRPACHKVHGEGMSVLTGDALHTLAMQIIANHPAPLKAEKRLRMITALSKACGPFGMAAGQALDISLMNNEDISDDLLINIYRLKTGALLTACIELGRLASSDDNEINQKALTEFGNCIGLAFQIQDDLLDMESAHDSLGKPVGLDMQNKKITYPKQHGLTQAKEKVQSLYEEALEAINYLGHHAKLLRELTSALLLRDR